MSSCLDASPLAEVLIEKEASRIHAKIKKLVAIKHDAASAGIPGVGFIIRRRVNDLQRNKKCLEADKQRPGIHGAADQKTHAVLQSKLRVEALAHHNVRDAARKLYAKVKTAKSKAKFKARALKKHLFIWNKEKRERRDTPSGPRIRSDIQSALGAEKNEMISRLHSAPQSPIA